MKGQRRMPRHIRYLLFALPILAPGAVEAQIAPAPESARSAQVGVVQRPRPDFFFGRPRTTVGIRGSWMLARADSDWFDFVTDELTLDREDFRAAGIAGEVGVALGRRLDLVIGADIVNTINESEFRDYVDVNLNAIEQTTELRYATLMGGLRFALTERGRELSSLAWVPHRLVPYAGGGGGALWYRVQQYGDFVDFQDLSIFSDLLESSGWTPAAYVNAGVDVHLVKLLYVTVDGRYLWASPELTEPWRSFEPLDLAGLRLSTGVSFLF